MESAVNEDEMHSSSPIIPYSRLFIVFGKGNHPSYEQIHSSFSQYGSVLNIKIVKDQRTNESKGICYVQYAKASSAAKSLEEMNGTLLGTKPLKVMLASDKHGQEDPEMLNDKNRSRLFLVISKSTTETELRNEFKEFGNLQYVKILTDSDGNSKGCAFVKFETPYSAALALENCPSNYKVEYAAPKKKQQEDSSYFDTTSSSKPPYYDTKFQPNIQQPIQGRKILIRFYSPIFQEHLSKLCSIPPQFEYCEILQLHATGIEGLATAVYSNQGAAEYARAKLNGFEYPPGCPLSVSISTNTTPNVYEDSNQYYSSVPPTPPIPSSPAPPSMMYADNSNLNYGNVCRVYFLCEPYPPTERILRETFQYYGTVTDAYIVRGKKFGFVTFDNPYSAQQSIKMLNNAKINEIQYSVRIARPRTESGSERETNEVKRRRFD